MRDGLIEAISDDDGREPTLDLGPCTVVPGLVDAHVHLCCDPAPGSELDPEEPHGSIADRARRNALALLNAGVTAVADCGGPTAVLVALRDEIHRVVSVVQGGRVVWERAPLAGASR